MAWFGVLLQLWLSIDLARANGSSASHGVIIYLGYFTVLTNIFVAVVCTAGSLRRRSALYTTHMIGCATAAALAVGLGYHFLLRNVWDPTGAQWVADVVLHYVVPAGALLHWLRIRPRESLRWWAPLSWCCYPLLYFGYVLIRGELLAAYPYPFVDVIALGYRQALINATGLLVGFVIIGYLLLWSTRVHFRSGVTADEVAPLHSFNENRSS